MTRKLKAMGAALVAVLAISALVASAAQAQFTVEGGGSATVTMEASSTNQTLKAAFGSIKCKKLHGTGSFTSGANELTIENVEYTECSALAGLDPVTVDFNTHCHYIFTSNTTSNPKKEEVHLSCSEGSITITFFPSGTPTPHEEHASPICVFHIFAPETATQTFPVTYDNVTLANGKMGVEVTFSEVALNTTHEGSLCGSGEETMHYTGTSRVSGTSGGSPVGITVT